MALILNRTTTSNYQANYWRVASLDLRPDGVRAEVLVYKDRESRVAGAGPVESASVGLGPLSEFLLDTNTNAWARAYTLLKTKPQFSGASDG